MHPLSPLPGPGLAGDHALHYELPEPDRVTLQINYGCNQRCLHCYQEAGPHLVERDREGAQDLMALMGHLHRLGFREVKIMGGEPLLHRALVPLLEEAGRLRLQTSLITGGSAGDHQTWERIDALVDAVWFSIYHVDPEIHDWLVQRRGALEALWRNAGRVTESTIKGFHLLLSKPVQESLEPTLTAICERGADVIKILWPSPDGAAVQNWALYDIPPQEWRRIHAIASAVRRLFPEVKIALAKHALDTADGEGAQDPRSACNYGDSKLWGVDPKGLLYPCCLLMEHEEYAIGHISELTTEEMARRVRALAERDQARHIGPFSGCGRCPALLAESGDDRRVSAGWEPVCPLFQVPVDLRVSGGAGS